MKWQSFWQRVLPWLHPVLITILCVHLLYLLGADHFRQSWYQFNYTRFIYIAIGVLSALGFLLAYRLDRRSSLVPEARSFFEYLRGHNRWVWITAASAGGALFVLTLGVTYFFGDTSWRSSAGGSVGSFATGVAAVLGISRFFQDRVLTTTRELLDFLAEDLEKLLRGSVDSGGVWFSYPGLGLGHYRALDEYGVDFSEAGANKDAGLEPGRKAWNRFHQALDAVIKNEHIPFTAFTWDASFLPRFFAHYEQKIHAGRVSQERFKAGVEKERALHNLVVGRKDRDARLYTVRPEALQVHAIVIGDIVYTIQTFGLPWYLAGNGAGRFVGGEMEVVTLIAHRKQSASLRRSVLQHFRELSGEISSAQLTGAKLCTNREGAPTEQSLNAAWSDVERYLAGAL